MADSDRLRETTDSRLPLARADGHAPTNRCTIMGVGNGSRLANAGKRRNGNYQEAGARTSHAQKDFAAV